MRTRLLTPAALVFLATVAGASPAERSDSLCVAGVFGDRAVLQRDAEVPVWGRAAPGAQVAVRFAGHVARAVAGMDGNWRLALPALPASEEGRTLVVESGDQRVERADILVGDVWVLAGQTNMVCPLCECEGGSEVAAEAELPWLRWFEHPGGPADRPERDVCAGSRWSACGPTVASGMSGVGYYFAQELRKHAAVPVGLIMTAAPGAGPECWARDGLLEAHGALAPALADYRHALKLYPARRRDWEERRAEWDRRAHLAEVAGMPVPLQDDFLRHGPLGPTHPLRPGALFNGRVAPLQPFGVRGVVWYDGESCVPAGQAAVHDRLLAALIRDWRKGWERHDLPFVLVQLPRYGVGPQGDPARVREAQCLAAQEVGNCALAVTIDCGDPDNPCPGDKRPVGERAALAARRVAYRDLNAPLSPGVLSVERRGKSLVVRFREAGRGLELRDAAATGFELREAFGPFRPASAEVVGRDAVRLWHPELEAPTLVRYAWGGSPAAALFSLDGLPAAPFRSGVTAGR